MQQASNSPFGVFIDTPQAVKMLLLGGRHTAGLRRGVSGKVLGESASEPPNRWHSSYRLLCDVPSLIIYLFVIYVKLFLSFPSEFFSFEYIDFI
jgi:hypothetical protein